MKYMEVADLEAGDIIKIIVNNDLCISNFIDGDWILHKDGVEVLSIGTFVDYINVVRNDKYGFSSETIFIDEYRGMIWSNVFDIEIIKLVDDI